MPEKEEAYVCNRCGYVLPKKDAVISGWDAQSSLLGDKLLDIPSISVL